MRKTKEQQERDKRIAEQIAEQRRLSSRGTFDGVIHTQSNAYGSSSYPYSDIDLALAEFTTLVNDSKEAWHEDHENRTLTLVVKINRHTVR